MVNLIDFSDSFEVIFGKEKDRISKVIKDIEIYHIGSTAIKEIKGKGIIDILIYAKNWGRKTEIVSELKSLGYKHVHPEENGRIFLSNRKETGVGDFHIHLTGNKKMVEELRCFVKVLNKDEKLRKEYETIKISASKIGNRKEYGKIKSKFIKKILG